ncbi:flagellar hook-basal body complex protein FliE [Pelagicoccus sp. SDUM812003]|uniref:flagellar hook-basal body complex protein FliE n=1 Tax=Pelagicoccus sp. SDUM812003 TaxID=3041267 RepID=UPI00280D4F6D|nr:flagellar hook-basal body complex protein FliE [Pelagicoccus sp. SDUM812003]MDQ8202529.1 flagellar hook-basal body complex protein FliE [Pelagicoccus sp. SDUM812003]
MIDSVSHLAAQQVFKQNAIEHAKLKSVEFPQGAPGIQQPSETKSFDNVVGKFIQEVDQKHKASAAEANRVLLGETDNIHQSMIAAQEAGLAFNLMVEVRNKLMNSYQELMKMPV